MKKGRTSTKCTLSVKCQDKTDWRRVYSQSQSQVDQELTKDIECPVLKKVRFQRINDK